VTFTLLQILGAFVAPALLVALIAGLAWKYSSDARWIFGPLITGAFALSYASIELKIGWPPNANVVYLPFYFAIAAGVLTLADSLAKPPIWLRILILLFLWRIAANLILVHLVPHSLSAAKAEMWADLSAAITAAWFIAFEVLANRAPGITTPLLLAAMSFAGAIVLALGWHIQSSGAMAVALALISLAGVVLVAVCRGLSFSRGFAQMIVIILQLLLLHGYFYTDDNLTHMQQLWIALLLAAPLLALIEIPALQTRRTAVRLAVRLGPAIILLAIVCAATARDFIRADQAAAAMGEE
jgi:hypothetical protein